MQFSDTLEEAGDTGLLQTLQASRPSQAAEGCGREGAAGCPRVHAAPSHPCALLNSVMLSEQRQIKFYASKTLPDRWGDRVAPRREPSPSRSAPRLSLIRHATGPGVGVGWPPQEDPNALPTCLLHYFTEDRRSGRGHACRSRVCPQCGGCPALSTPWARPPLLSAWCGASFPRGCRCPVRPALAAQRQTEGPHSNAKSQGLRPSQPSKQGRYFSINSK